MWRRVPRSTWAVGAVFALAIAAGDQIGAAPLMKKKGNAPLPSVEEAVGDLAAVFQSGEISVEGVGLVAGLDNTGGDAPPSWFRTQLVDEMSKAGVEHASELLQNKQFSLVLVRMKIPTGASPKDRFDVEVVLPPASGTRSLAGGFLMSTRLSEVLVAGGSPRTGSDIAFAGGPVVTGSAKEPGDLKTGRVLGGGRVKKDFPYQLLLAENKRSIRNAGLMEKVVNERFHQNERGQQKGAATAKSDSVIVLKVPEVYHQNQERFFRVVQLLPMIDAPALRAERQAGAGAELMTPKTSGVAALKLEALGPSAAETLEKGLTHPDPQVQFFAAEALAYLNNPAGVDVLGKTAIAQKPFRAYALAALAAMEDDTARIKLRKLMDEPDIEVRYGAFNALRTLDPLDAALGRVRILDAPYDQEEIDPEDPDAMALAIAASHRPRPEDPFSLFIVESEGPPVVHVSRSRRSEVVVFGRGQKLQTPIVLGAGQILLNAAQVDETVDISKITPSKTGDDDLRVRSSLVIGEVIRHIANMGATYPEVISILEAAHKQQNLPGPLFVDSVPTANVEYFEKSILGESKPKKDAKVEQTGMSRLRRLFSLRGRVGRDENVDADGHDADHKPSGKAEADEKDHAKTTAEKATPKADEKPDADSKPGDLKTAPDGDPRPAKKDDALQKTSASSEPEDQPTSTSRFRLLDRLRRRGE